MNDCLFIHSFLHLVVVVVVVVAVVVVVVVVEASRSLREL